MQYVIPRNVWCTQIADYDGDIKIVRMLAIMQILVRNLARICDLHQNVLHIFGIFATHGKHVKIVLCHICQQIIVQLLPFRHQIAYGDGICVDQIASKIRSLVVILHEII